MSTTCFGSVIVYERLWQLNARKRNMQLTNSSCHRLLPSASHARSANGTARLAAVIGAMKSLLARDAPPGAPTHVVALGNANTSGVLLDRGQSAAPNITAFVLAVLLRVATARSITSNRATARATVLGVIIICNPTALAVVVLRCCATHITPRSQQRKPPRELPHEQMHDARPMTPLKLRSNSWHFETETVG